MNEIRPIRSDADNDAALAEVERLWGAPLGTPEGDRLDVLATLIEAYERQHIHFEGPPPDAVDELEFKLDQQQITRKDLARLLGSRARVSEIMNRQRGLSLAMIRRLHAELNIPAEILIREYRIKPGRKAATTSPARSAEPR